MNFSSDDPGDKKYHIQIGTTGRGRFFHVCIQSVKRIVARCTEWLQSETDDRESRATEYQLKVTVLTKWAKENEHVLKNADLVKLKEESKGMQENKVARVTEVYPRADDIIKSMYRITSSLLFWNHAVKLVPVFLSVSEIEVTAVEVGV